MRKFILLLTFLSISIVTYAQDIDYVNSYNMMRQYNNIMMNQFMEQFSETIGQLYDEQKANADACALLIPSDKSHKFGAFIMLSFLTISEIRITYTNNDLDSYEIAPSQCMKSGSYVLIPYVLRPGYTLKLVRKSNSKLLYEEKIPLSNSASYQQFLSKVQQNLNLATSFLSPYGNQQPNGITCKSCHGTGRCGTCNGKGYYQGSYNTGNLKCPNCSESNGRICTVCKGTGKW